MSTSYGAPRQAGLSGDTRCRCRCRPITGFHSFRHLHHRGPAPRGGRMPVKSTQRGDFPQAEFTSAEDVNIIWGPQTGWPVGGHEVPVSMPTDNRVSLISAPPPPGPAPRGGRMPVKSTQRGDFPQTEFTSAEDANITWGPQTGWPVWGDAAPVSMPTDNKVSSITPAPSADSSSPPPPQGGGWRVRRDPPAPLRPGRPAQR